jgi:hypothetical protein
VFPDAKISLSNPNTMLMLPIHYEIEKTTDTVHVHRKHLHKLYVGLRSTILGLLRASRTTGIRGERETLDMRIESRGKERSCINISCRDTLDGGLVGESL